MANTIPSPLDNLIGELSELATGLYEFLRYTEALPERPGWKEQLEQYARKTLRVRLLAGQCDRNGLHDACLQQQNYLQALIKRDSVPAAGEWEYLERWPLLVLPCLMTPVSEAAVDELIAYFRDTRRAVPLNERDADRLRTSLSTPAGIPKEHESNIVTLPGMQAPAAASTVRFVLQHELHDTVTEFLNAAALPAATAAEQAQALRLCADRIQLLGISAAGSDLMGLMDCCLLCHDTLLKYLEAQAQLSPTGREQIKIWAGLMTRYLDTPGSAAAVDALLEFYQRGHFIPPLLPVEYDSLRTLLSIDAAVQASPRIEIKAGAERPPTAQIVTMPFLVHLDRPVELGNVVPAAQELPPPLPRQTEPAPAPEAESTGAMLRVPAKILDTLLHLASESNTITGQLQERLRLSLNALSAHASDENFQQLARHLAVFAELLPALARITKEGQEAVLRMRRVPVSGMVPRLQRSVRQICRAAGKQVNLTVNGADILLDREILDNLSDALLHPLRHAINHGIESAALRHAAGKPETGAIELRFVQDGGHLTVHCRDDGAGLGYTGTGLDPMYADVMRLKGSVVIACEAQRGCNIEIRIPLNMLSAHVLMVPCGAQVLAISSRCIEQILDAGAGHLQAEGERLQYRLGQEVYAACEIEQLLHLPAAHSPLERAQRPVLLVRGLTARLHAVLVEQVLSSQDVEVKPLGPYLPALLGIEGATILGNGNVAVVIDLRGLLQTAQPAQVADAEIPV